MPAPGELPDFGKIIRDARVARGWSQEELGRRAELSRPTIARVERGDDISTATLAKIAAVLGLTLEMRTVDES
ncbi:helix-turn-helix transcriptional regulator [Microbacterium sp. BLY]|nr:helix-turn-helix transcriptional regulator [Microbacterium sp. BLY]